MAGRDINQKKKALELYRQSYEIYTDLSPLLEMENLLEEEGNFPELLTIFGLELNHLEGIEKAKKLHKMGKIFLEKLNEVEKAHDALSSAFELNPAEPATSLDLLQLRLKLKNLEGLKEVVDKSLTLILHQRKDLLFECGKVFFEGGKNEWARDVLKVLKDIERENLEVLNLLYEVHKNLSEWESILETGMEIVELIKKKDKNKCLSLLNELGQISRDNLKNEERAVEFFRNAVSIDPSFLKARENLAELLINLKRDKEAFEESKKVLLAHPTNLKILHFLAYYYEKNHLPDRAFCIVSILNLLGEMDSKVEKIIYEAAKEKAGRLPSGGVSTEERERLYHHYEIPELRNFFLLAGDFFIPISGLDVLTLGTSKDALISSKSGHPFLKPLEEAGNFLGLKEIQLYISPLKGEDILSPSPNSLVIGSKISRYLNAEILRFVMVKFLELSIRGYSFINLIPEEKAYSIFLGFIALANPNFKHKDMIDSKVVSKALPIFKKSAIIKKIGEIFGEAKEVPDIKAFKKHLLGVKMSAGRVALLFSPNLVLAVKGEAVLLKEEFPHTAERIKEFVEKFETLSDLLRFYSSDSYFSLREKLGVSVV